MRLLLVVCVWLLPVAAQAQGVCGPRAAIVDALKTKYSESPAAYGIAGSRNLAELFVSRTGSWTMLVSAPNGPSCILATGDGWQDLPPTVAADPA